MFWETFLLLQIFKSLRTCLNINETRKLNVVQIDGVAWLLSDQLHFLYKKMLSGEKLIQKLSLCYALFFKNLFVDFHCFVRCLYCKSVLKTCQFAQHLLLLKRPPLLMEKAQFQSSWRGQSVQFRNHRNITQQDGSRLIYMSDFRAGFRNKLAHFRE